VCLSTATSAAVDGNGAKDDKVSAAATLLLVAELLDTIATVFVNGVVVGRSSSTHLRFTADITAAAREGCNNTIAIVFDSALRVGRDRERANEAAAAAHNASAVHVASILDSDAPGCHPPLYDDDPTRKSAATREPNDDGHIWVRKPTANYGWNWGPCFTAGGILRPMLIASFSASAPLLEDVAPVVSQATGGGGGFQCELRVTVLAPAGTTSVRISVATEWGERSSQTYPLGPSVGMGRHNVSITLAVEQGAVELWWPRRMGKQKLYAVNVTVSSATDPPSPPSVTASELYASTISKTVGFRSVELITSPGFSLKVNGHDLFAFGANVIPLSSFEPSFTEDMIDGLLDAAVDQHINLLRVWGGGKGFPLPIAIESRRARGARVCGLLCKLQKHVMLLARLKSGFAHPA
jgi:beta-mannosidase